MKPYLNELTFFYQHVFASISVTHKRDTPYKKKRKEKDNSKEKVLQLNIKDTKHVFHKDAIFFQKIDTYFVFFAISFSVSYLFF